MNSQQYSLMPKDARTQKCRILSIIEEQGYITKWGAIYHAGLHCSKLSTRLGEIEQESGIRFERSMIYHHDSEGKKHPVGMKYWLPEGITINDIRTRIKKYGKFE